MPKSFDVIAILSSAAMMARKADTFPPETHAIDLAELRQIILEVREKSQLKAD